MNQHTSKRGGGGENKERKNQKIEQQFHDYKGLIDFAG